MDSIEEKYLKLLAEHENLKTNPECQEQCSNSHRHLNVLRQDLTNSIKKLYSSWVPPKVYSFFESMKALIKTGFKKSDITEKRLEICNSCEYMKNNSTCILCGCYMKAKASIPGAQCPIAKWKAED